jgi:hypothetical protein
MRITQYVRQEKAIAAADSGGIRERWLWGLRLLNDADMFAPRSSQLKPGRAVQLIKTAAASDLKLSEREIRYRLQCARAYPTAAQIRHACAEFPSWSDLRSAGFPPFEAPEGEPPADYRTDSERDHDHARALMDLIGEQGSLFPLRDFEPVTTTLKDLQLYTEQQEDLTARFVEHGRRRRLYLESLIRVADNDMSMLWAEAQRRLDEPEETS